MNFDRILRLAKAGDRKAIEHIHAMYDPLIRKKAWVDGQFDEDLYQVLSATLTETIRKFPI